MSGGILDSKLSPRASRAPVFVSTFIRQSDLDKIQVNTHRGSSGTKLCGAFKSESGCFETKRNFMCYRPQSDNVTVLI